MRSTNTCRSCETQFTVSAETTDEVLACPFCGEDILSSITVDDDDDDDFDERYDEDYDDE